MKIDLSDVTFLVPIRIDSSDRLRNIFLSVSYLLKNFETNIIVKESDSESLFNKYLKRFFDGKITYVFEKNDNSHFHRTRIINDMVMDSKTKFVCNYDADIILPIETYIKAKFMLESGYDVVYPYRYGVRGEKKVNFVDNDNFFNNVDLLPEQEFAKNNFNIDILEKYFFYDRNALGEGFANYGMCQFFDRNVYINGFLENENFISYAPEDKERFYRFSTLGYNIGRIDESAYHMEHSRNHNSSNSNPYMNHNLYLWENLKKLNKQQIIDYYRNQEYYKARIK